MVIDLYPSVQRLHITPFDTIDRTGEETYNYMVRSGFGAATVVYRSFDASCLVVEFHVAEGMSFVRNIYILLSRPHSLVSSLIAFFTRAEYSHISVAYDRELRSLCSFARKYRLPLPGGLVAENENGVLRKPLRNAKCVLLAASVPEDAFDAFRSRIDAMLASRDKYHYFLWGLFCCCLGMETYRENHYFCSQFVAEMLTCAGVRGIPKPPSLMKPLDFLEIPGLTCVYSGVLCEYLSQAAGENRLQGREQGARCNDSVPAERREKQTISAKRG